MGRPLGWVVWGLPAALFVAGIIWPPGRPWLWIPSLLVAGSACLANARRCGRLHCFVTGPVFLVGAVVTILGTSGVVALDWSWIASGVVGGTVLGYGLEWARGRYVRGQSSGESVG